MSRNPHVQPTWTGCGLDAKGRVLCLKGTLHGDFLEGLEIPTHVVLKISHRLTKFEFFFIYRVLILWHVFFLGTS